MAEEKFESALDSFGKFIHRFLPETKKLNGKLERNLIELYKQSMSYLIKHVYIYIYIYIYYNSVGCHLLTLWVCVEPSAI